MNVPFCRALQTAKSIFPGKVSIDLMFGQPHQTLDDWSKELSQVSSKKILIDNEMSCNYND